MINRYFQRETLAKEPWKNGGGITREIAKSKPGTGFWRVSIADVNQEGAFSTFPHLARILTVIDGSGMILIFPDREIEALLHKPVTFAGDDEVTGRLPDGPIQNFNLIYDADLYDASVDVFQCEDLEGKRPKGCELQILYCLAGSVSLANGEKLPLHSGIINPSHSVKAASEAALLLEIKLSSRP